MRDHLGVWGSRRPRTPGGTGHGEADMHPVQRRRLVKNRAPKRRVLPDPVQERHGRELRVNTAPRRTPEPRHAEQSVFGCSRTDTRYETAAVNANIAYGCVCNNRTITVHPPLV